LSSATGAVYAGFTSWQNILENYNKVYHVTVMLLYTQCLYAGIDSSTLFLSLSTVYCHLACQTTTGKLTF